MIQSILKTRRFARIIATFYSGFIWPSAVVTLSCAVTYYLNGYAILGTLVWIKIILNTLTAYFIHSFRPREYYYYQNLGFSKSILWSLTFIVDFILFVLILLLAGFIRRWII